MRSLPALHLLAALVFSAVLSETSPAQNAAPALSKDAALDHLLAERDSEEAMKKAVDDARASGVSEQAILEARFLFHVDRGEDAGIAAMLPEFQKRRDDFKLQDSAIFGVKEDWLAVIEYVSAMDALQKGDKAAFKQHITEAFWLSPRQAAAFVPQVERIRLEESMRSMKLDFSTSYQPVRQGDAVPLKALISGKKALLLHFWSPLSPECEASMPDFASTAAELEAHGVAIASFISDDAPKQLNAARGMIDGLGARAAGAWLIDSREKSLGSELRVRTLPTMVLVSTDGAVLFNGDPTDDGFWNALTKLDAMITRPQSSLEKAK